MKTGEEEKPFWIWRSSSRDCEQYCLLEVMPCSHIEAHLFFGRTSVNFHETTPPHTPEDSTLQGHFLV
jgi:hypothetical protein